MNDTIKDAMIAKAKEVNSWSIHEYFKYMADLAKSIKYDENGSPSNFWVYSLDRKTLYPSKATADLRLPFYEYICMLEPEPKLVPFTKEDHALFMGKVITRDDFDNMFVITSCDTKSVCSVSKNITYSYLLSYYKFADGSPCGKYEN